MEQSIELKKRLLAGVILGNREPSTKSRSFSPVVAFILGTVVGVVLTTLLFNSSI
jgi:hypothetical protein